MIQRIQTVYIAMAVLLLGMMYLFPIATYQWGEESLPFNVSGAHFGGENLVAIPFSIVVPIVMVLLLLVIFMYKNRPLQVRLGRISYIILLGLVAMSYLAIGAVRGKLPNPDEVAIVYGLSAIGPIAALILVFLANRAIRKDEELVKSVDRLR